MDTLVKPEGIRMRVLHVLFVLFILIPPLSAIGAEQQPGKGVQVSLAPPAPFHQLANFKTVDIQAMDTQRYLRDAVQKNLVDKIANLQKQLKDKCEALRKEHPNLTPDEADIRIDLGGAELGYDPLETEKLPFKELTLKDPGGSGFELSIGITGTWDAPRLDYNKIKIGYAKEDFGVSGVEAKYGIEIDASKDINDYYDGEWQKESEWRIVRFVEGMVAKTDFYVGGAGGLDAENVPLVKKVNVGVEVSWNVRERYSRWLFKDMYDSLDRLQEQQQHQEQWRRNKIEQEAKRLGIDPKGKNTRQLIKSIHDVWEKYPNKRRTIFPPPYGYLTTHHQQHDHYCTNRPKINAPVVLPPVITAPVASAPPVIADYSRFPIR